MAGQSNIFTQVSYGPEASAYGTEAVTYAALPRVQSATIDSENGLIYDWGLGEGLNAVKTYYGPFNASGSVTTNVTDFDFLKHWIGQKTGAGSGASHYILTEGTDIAAGASAAGRIVPFSIEMASTDGTDTVAVGLGCVGTTFNLDMSIGKPVSFTGQFVAQKTLSRTTSASYTPSTEGSFLCLGGSFKWGASPSALSGVQKLNISFDGGLITGDATRSIESRFIDIPRLGMRKYKFTCEIIMASALGATIINDFYGTESPSGTYTPNVGSTTNGPTASLEVKAELVSGGKYAYVMLDECSIDKIGRTVQLGTGLVILRFEGTARKATGGVPIEWWTA
jgi:hypothetical protein